MKRQLPPDLTSEDWAGIHAAIDVGDLTPPPRRGPIQALRDGKVWVYFIAGPDTPIKIGLSNAPHERLASLQTAHWAKLEIIGKVEGGPEVEKAYHQRFVQHRLNGEWFARHPDILAEIDRIRSPTVPVGNPGA